MIQKHDFIKFSLVQKSLSFGQFSVPDGATAWSQDTLTVSRYTDDPSSKVYDGTILAAVIPGTLMGVSGNDTVFIAETATAYYSTAVVGTNKPVCISYTLGGPQAEAM